MDFLDLFIVALLPVLKTLIITAVGLFLALERVNILGYTARHNLNNLVFFIFTPGLVASSLANTITLRSLKQLWFMPVNILLTFIIGSALGWILVKITRTPQHLHGLVIGCCSAGNLGNLLLIIIPAVCQDSSGPFGDSSSCSTRGEGYASLSMAIGAVFIWTYVYNIIRIYAVPSNSIDKLSQSGGSEIVLDDSSSIEEALLSKNSSNSEYNQSQTEITLLDCSENDKVTIGKKMKHHLKSLSESINLKMLFAPSTIATIVGLSIGAISPLRNLFVGNKAALHVIDSSASMLGDATVPSMTLIVGANLLRGLKTTGVGKWLVFGVVVVRFVALPLLGILIVKGAHHFGMVGSDSLYQFVLLLQYALPSAMTMGTLTQLFRSCETECSVIMLWNYLVAAVALTLWTTYYLWIVS
ncbi:hypothetical protein M9H77_05119 [Catharanthus roseus]|uniref:Uncharacterized protein n=1 Tax=Catharanthus roseus TaxID=4058 RepID=A0ACC0CGL3_CATRO|nr:hypothetical protein M9H77_05119 [Catharanthus roseus]